MGQNDFEGDRLDTDLMDLFNYLVGELAKFHPFTQPGLWDSTVDRIRAVRTAMEAQQSRRIISRLAR